MVPDVVVTLEGDQLWIEVPNAIYDRLHTEAFYRAIAKPDPAAKSVLDAIDPALMDQETVSTPKPRSLARSSSSGRCASASRRCCGWPSTSAPFRRPIFVATRADCDR